jgi:hypothetical protein
MIDDVARGYSILQLILTLHLENRLTILDGGLCHYHTRPDLEQIAMPHDFATIGLGEDPPIFSRLSSVL